MKNKILVIAAHPDDEVLGAGGTIRKHSKNGDEVYCLILGLGVKSRFNKESLNDDRCSLKEKLRIKQSQDCGKVLGIKDTFFEDLPDNKFDSISLLDITKKIEGYIGRIKPDIVYTHYENDLNVDHRVVFRAVITACRPCNTDCPSEIYSFEVLSSTEWQLEGKKFKPNVYINTEKEIDEKIKATEKYKLEIKDYPHSRSLEGVKILAKYRGLEAGLKAAEAFILVRSIK